MSEQNQALLAELAAELLDIGDPGRQAELPILVARERRGAAAARIEQDEVTRLGERCQPGKKGPVTKPRAAEGGREKTIVAPAIPRLGAAGQVPA